MFGIVLVTHGGIGEEMLKVLNEIVGHQDQAVAISVGAEDDMEDCRNTILNAIKETNTGEGVVMITDMFGGTPSNLAISMMPHTDAVVLVGANLPLLVKLASVRETKPLLEAVVEAEAAGKKYIQRVTETMTGNN